jgi:hypothetical protein
VLRFNAAEAFTGTVLIDIEDPPTQNEDAAPKDEVDDRRTLVYKMFLAAPYVPHGDGYLEQKWSGTDQAGDNTSHIGCVMDTFTHHTLVDSNQTAVVVDLQGVSSFGSIFLQLNHSSQFPGIQCPGGEVVLFDPQMHTYVITKLIICSYLA